MVAPKWVEHSNHSEVSNPTKNDLARSAGAIARGIEDLKVVSRADPTPYLAMLEAIRTVILVVPSDESSASAASAVFGLDCDFLTNFGVAMGVVCDCSSRRSHLGDLFCGS